MRSEDSEMHLVSKFNPIKIYKVSVFTTYKVSN